MGPCSYIEIPGPGSSSYVRAVGPMYGLYTYTDIHTHFSWTLWASKHAKAQPRELI